MHYKRKFLIILSITSLLTQIIWAGGTFQQQTIDDQDLPSRLIFHDRSNDNQQNAFNQGNKEIVQKIHSLPSEIKVGGVFPIVKRPEAGRDRRDAFLIAIHEINNQTGSDRILPVGVTLKPIVKDDDNSVAGGTQAAQELIAAGVDIVIGSSGSQVSEAMAAELGPHKIPQISYASSSPTLSNRTEYPYFMRVSSSDSDQAKAIADLVLAFNWTKGATIYSDDSYGTGQKNYFTQLFEAKGGTILTDQPFTTGVSDVSSQIQAIKLVAPDFILGSFIDFDATTVMAEARNQNIDTIPWIMTDGWSMPSTFSGNSTVQEAMQKAVGTAPIPYIGPKYDEFNTTWFDTAWNWLEGPANSQTNNVMFDYLSHLAYDAVYVAAKGLAAAGTTDGDTLLSALYSVTHEGASRSIEFNLQGEIPGQFGYVQLRDSTFYPFGNWQGTPSFDTGTIFLNDDSSWLAVNNVLTKLTTRGSISITNDNDLNTTFPGMGTKSNPIRIEGYNITDSSNDLIHIQDMTFYLHIKNNYLDGTTPTNRPGYFGISLNNVVHVTIENNFITNNTNDGIGIYFSQNNNIINNTIVNNGLNGIRLEPGNNHKIVNNIISNNVEGGISTFSSSDNNLFSNNLISSTSAGGGIGIRGHNNTIFKNTIYNNTHPGIGLIDNSNNNTIDTNIIHDNYATGIDLELANNNTISNNHIYSNDGNGIRVSESENNSIFYNEISKNSGSGIGLESTNYTNISYNIIYGHQSGSGVHITHSNNENIVKYNDFRDNLIIDSQVIDDGQGTLFLNNYFEDWSGIGSYFIHGDAGNQDPSPLTNPYHLSTPVITVPTSATLTLKDSVTIQWTASSDIFGHSLTYSVFYSDDTGATWNELASGLTTTSYTWDLTAVYDDAKVMIKVQAVDSIGFRSTDMTTEVFTVENPSLTTTTTTTSTTTTTTEETTTTTTTTTSEPDVTTPGLTGLLVLCTILSIITLRKRNRKFQ